MASKTIYDFKSAAITGLELPGVIRTYLPTRQIKNHLSTPSLQKFTPKTALKIHGALTKLSCAVQVSTTKDSQRFCSGFVCRMQNRRFEIYASHFSNRTNFCSYVATGPTPIPFDNDSGACPCQAVTAHKHSGHIWVKEASLEIKFRGLKGGMIRKPRKKEPNAPTRRLLGLGCIKWEEPVDRQFCKRHLP